MLLYPIRGITRDGTEVWYTGRAGEGFVSADKAQAFYGFYLAGARACATRLNRMTEIHGIRFVVPVDGGVDESTIRLGRIAA